MIYEYALEPSVLSFWASNDRDYAEFIREYGLGTPRVFSSFPKKKASKLRSYYLQNSPMDSQSLRAQRYTEMVAKLTEDLILREIPEPQAGDWCELAKAENERLPFSVVLSSGAIDIPRNITPANMYSPDSIWNHSRQKDFARTVDGLSSVVADLLRLSTDQIIVVDTFGWTPEAVVAMQQFITLIRANRVSSKLPSVRLYYKEKRGSGNSGNGSPSAPHVRQQILEGINGNGADIDLQVFELREVQGSDVFHNRCILTEHGGIITGHGIGISGEKAHTDEAVLMESKIYEKKLRQFLEGKTFQVISNA